MRLLHGQTIVSSAVDHLIQSQLQIWPLPKVSTMETSRHALKMHEKSPAHKKHLGNRHKLK